MIQVGGSIVQITATLSLSLSLHTITRLHEVRLNKEVIRELTGVVKEENQRYDPCQDDMSCPHQKS